MNSLNRDLRYGTQLHSDTVSKLRERIESARRALGDRYTQWTQMEESFIAYMPTSELDEIRKQARAAGEPTYTTLDIPYSYATALTAHTYLTSTFFARNPVIQVQGRHGETQMQEQQVEAVMDYQVQTGKQLVPYYVWMLDPLKYGVGILGYYYEEEKKTIGRYEDVPDTFLGIPIPGKTKKQYTEEVIRGYEGCKLYNVRPQDWFPDPRFSFCNFQKGEFCGRYVDLSYLDILAAPDDYINLETLKENRRDQGATLRIQGSSQIILPNQTPTGTSTYTSGPSSEISSGTVQSYEVYVRLIPEEWKLGKSRVPQKWIFLLADNDVIIQAKPLGYYHDKFPFEVLEQEVDGHALYARSMMEITRPLNDVLTWLVNSHFYNVRKSLNDQFVADPSRIVMKDLMNPEPGKLIRLKPAAYGADVRTVVSQLPVQDITRSHLNDSQMVNELISRVTGINDNIMGAVNTGRRSATEVRSSTTFGINRLKTMTEYYSAMGFAPLCEQMIQTTQQFMKEDRYYRVVGDLAVGGNDRFLNVSPEDILGFYDWVPVDGTLPVDRMSQVNMWVQLFSQMQQLPQIAMQYDMGRIFAFVAQLAGLKNINQFRINVVPNGAMANGVQAGNVIPINAGGPGGAPPVAAPGGNIQPTQVPGLGQAL